MVKDPRRLPVGAVTQRANGAVWRKDAHGKDMTQVKPPDRQPGSKRGLPPALPSHNPPESREGWQALRKSLKLDGHLPDDTIHPSMVQIDLEGDTDSKPVLTWTDHTGKRRHTYSQQFHHHRAQHLKGEVDKTHHALEGAHAAMQLKLHELSGRPDGDAVAAAITHLVTGHRVSDLLKLKGAHAQLMGGTNYHPKQPFSKEDLEAIGDVLGAEDEGGDSTKEKSIQKSYTSNVPHPDRVHLMMTHPSGAVYPSHFVDKHVADHLMTSAHRDDVGGPLFHTTPEAVQRELEEHGVGDVDPAVVRHHAVSRMASDMLAKMPEVDLGVPGNFDVAKAHINTVSDEIGKRFGHQPAPEGMSFVPPHIIASYFHHSNGHALWPKVFPPCTSPNEDGSCSTTPTEPSSSGSPDTASTSSTPPTSPPKPKTPIPSPSDSSHRLIKGRAWEEVADEVEEVLAKAYALRLAPAADDSAPRYLSALTHIPIDEVVRGVRVVSHGEAVDVVEVNGDRAIVKAVGGEFEVGVEDIATGLAAGDMLFWAKAQKVDRSMARLASMSVQQLIDEKLVPKKKETKHERGQRGYLRRAAKLAKLARNGDKDALVELKHVVGALQARPLEGSFSTDTLSKDDTFHYADGTIAILKGLRGPSGDPIGTVREHADGSRWEKRDDGWHEIGDGGTTSAQGDTGQGDLKPTKTVGHQHALRVLEALRQRIANTQDERERARLKMQIAVIRQRLAVYSRTETAGLGARENAPKVSQDMELLSKSEALIDRMHGHLKITVSKAMAATPQDAIAQVVIGDDLAAQAELASLRNFGADPITTIHRWMKGA